MGNIMNKMKGSIIGLWKKDIIDKREVSEEQLKIREKYQKQCRRIKSRDEIVAAEMKEEEEEQLILLSLVSLQGDDDDNIDQKKNLPNLNLKLVAKLRTLIKEDLDILRAVLELTFRFTEQECSNSDICNYIPALHLYFAVARDILEHNISCQSSTISQLLPYPLLPELQAWIHSPENRLQNTKRRLKLWRRALRLYTQFYNDHQPDSSTYIRFD